MLHFALLFILIAGLFEAVILYQMTSLEWLEKKIVITYPKRVKGSWFKWETDTVRIDRTNVIHLSVILFALWYHKQTIIGTFVAMASGLISFMIVPLVIYIKREKRNAKTV